MKTQEIDRIWHWRTTLFVGFLLAFVLLLGVSFGPISLDFMKILRTLFGLSGGLQDEEKILLLQLRLPRVMLAALVGAALATSGAVYQTVFRNPLADPYLLGAAAGADNSGYPQLSAEYLLKSDPQVIFLADAQYGVTADSVSKRAGWSQISAVKNKKIVELPADIPSRWGPRLVDFYKLIGASLAKVS